MSASTSTSQSSQSSAAPFGELENIRLSGEGYAFDDGPDPAILELQQRVGVLEQALWGDTRTPPQPPTRKQSLERRLNALAKVAPYLFNLPSESSDCEACALAQGEKFSELIRNLVVTGWKPGDDLPDSIVTDADAIHQQRDFVHKAHTV